MNRKSAFLAAAIFTIAPMVGSAATIDFTAFADANIANSSWQIVVDFDGTGAWTAESQSSGSGPFAFGATSGFSLSGDMTPGISGSLIFVISGSDGKSIQIRSGTGLGVSGRNAGRIDWNEDLDGASERMHIDVNYIPDTADLGFLKIQEFGLTNYQNANSDAQIRGFDGLVYNSFATGTTSAVVPEELFTLTDADGLTQMRIRDRDTNAGGAQGFSLGSITFDVVIPEPSSFALLSAAVFSVIGTRRR